MDPRERVGTRVDELNEDLVVLSHAVHADAEVAFEEHNSSRRVADELARGGFEIELGVCDLETAFVAKAGTGPLRVGICAEYDALPGIGHACGHNVIAAAAVGAGLALAEIADDLGVEVRVLGTPAEEGGGGKIAMMSGGAFDGLHAAMMVHPAPVESPTFRCLAVQHLDVNYTGRAAHASAYPELGVNAADALTVAQVAIGLLRQHLRQSDRVHGIVTSGGDAPNIVPAHTAGTWYVRAATLAELAEVYPRVQRCFEAGALATDAELTVAEPGPAYSEFLHDAQLAGLYTTEAESIGRIFPAPGSANPLTGSTDMANVSLAMPAIHPMLGIDAAGAVNHQPAFTVACVNASADRAVRDGALAMARTMVAAVQNTAVRDRLLARAYTSAGDQRASADSAGSSSSAYS